MYNEKDCIYYKNIEECTYENKKECCAICKDKTTLKEGETIHIAENYDITRKDGKITKENYIKELTK